MTITYNKNKLKEIIDDICLLTGLSMCVLNTDFITLYTKEKKEDAFCHNIQKTKEGAHKCLCSDIKMLNECAKTRKPVSHICHAGLIDTVVPIIKSGIIAGYIIIGRVRPMTMPDLATNDEKLRKDYKKLTYLSKKQLSALVELLSGVLFENAVEIEYDDFISKATEYISENIGQKLSIESLCKALYVSKNYLYSSFHSYYGVTCGEYITAKRIDLAKKMLGSTDSKATNIAKKLGFDNYTYFCKLFKRKTGQSPSEFRKNIKGANLI